MRALLFGLVGAVLVAGCAEAKVCPVDGATFRLVAAGGQLHDGKALEGTTLRVVKAASKFTVQRNPANGDETTPGELNMLLKGKGGSFWVTSFYAPGSVPAFGGASDEVSKSGSIKWDVRDRTKERKFSLASDVPVMIGPLQGYELRNLSCR